jgi:hypothetical protein
MTSPHPAVQEVLAHYGHEFEQATHAKPSINPAVDAEIVLGLVREHGVDTVKRAMSAMFSTDDEFVRRTGFRLSLFRNQFNSFLAAAAKQSSGGCGHSPPCETNTQHINRLLGRTAEVRH